MSLWCCSTCFNPDRNIFWFCFSINSSSSLMLNSLLGCFFLCVFHSFILYHNPQMHGELAIVPSIRLTAKPLHQQNVNVLRLEIKDLFETSTPPVCFIMHHPGSTDIKSQVNQRFSPFSTELYLNKAAVIFSMEGCFTTFLYLHLQPLLAGLNSL